MELQMSIQVERVQSLGVEPSREHVDHQEDVHLTILGTLGDVGVIGVE